MTPVTVCGMGSPHHTAARRLSLLGVRPEFAVSVRFVRCRRQGPLWWPRHPEPATMTAAFTRSRTPTVVVTAALLTGAAALVVAAAAPASAAAAAKKPPGQLPAGYKNLVVIYEENHSFDNL